MTATVPTVRLRRFTRNEYERMAAQGIFGPDERVELVEGEILLMTPQGTRHATVLRLMTRALEGTFAPGEFDVRTQLPLALDPDGEPEPDIAVVAGSPDDFLAKHPTTAVLVVEVAESSLAFDRKKASTYARAKVQEYWIANLVDGVLEVHRDPQMSSPDGTWSYALVKRVKPRGSVQPLGAPEARLKVSTLLR
jgi:Uma2 family endonuclease